MAITSRIALLSDLHGNLHALERVLRHVDTLGVDGIACLGDVATLGPRPRETLGLMAHRASWLVEGNHDAFMGSDAALLAYSDVPPILAAVRWCRDQLDPQELSLLRSFEVNRVVDLGRGNTLLLFHGSPTSNTQDLWSHTPPAELDTHLAGWTHTVMAGGHTHLAMVRQHGGRLLVNPGSVGLPFKAPPQGGPPQLMPHAEYAVVEATRNGLCVRNQRVELDVDVLCQEARAWDHPLAAYLLSQYRPA